MIGVVIPAHNEERSLPRLLQALAPSSVENGLDIVVVANGCTDRTADVARDHGVRVIETPVPSKIRALALGDQDLRSFPRLYVDGDVVITHQDVLRLVHALRDGVHAVGPRRVLPMAGVSRPVRDYYRVWQQLPGVRTELYGRGVIAVDQVGHDRLSDWSDVMSDDLLIAMSFAERERLVVTEASVEIHPPKTYRDLVRRRLRAMTGNLLLASKADAPALRGSGASLGYLVRLGAREPRMLPGIGVFCLTALLARLGAAVAKRRGDTTWHRDESSRT